MIKCITLASMMLFTTSVIPMVTPQKDKDIICMAQNLYFEGRGESTKGMVAIGDVVRARVLRPNWPSSICEVVWEKRWSKKYKKWVPQFSWTLDGKSDNPHEIKQWNNILILAEQITFNEVSNDFVADHYHSTSVDPYWAKKMVSTGTVGNHIFYDSYKELK